MPAAAAMSSMVVLRTPCRVKHWYAASSTRSSRASDMLTIVAQIVSLSSPLRGIRAKIAATVRQLWPQTPCETTTVVQLRGSWAAAAGRGGAPGAGRGRRSGGAADLLGEVVEPRQR